MGKRGGSKYIGYHLFLFIFAYKLFYMETFSNISEDSLKKWNEELTSMLLWGPPPDTRTEEEKYLDTLKFAIVKINNVQDMVWCSNEDNKCYERDYTEPYGSEPIIPLKEITDFEFVRWARPMDM